jgi:hypothetical protein
MVVLSWVRGRNCATTLVLVVEFVYLELIALFVSIGKEAKAEVSRSLSQIWDCQTIARMHSGKTVAVEGWGEGF